MKKNKKFLMVCFSFIILLLGFFILTSKDKNTSFTIFEKQWLENNKSKVIDISILKDIPIINYNGVGILFDFLEDFEEATGLDFNPIAYDNVDSIKTDYSFQVVSSKSSNDLLFYSDSYSLLTTSNVKYNKLSEISDLVIGVLESDYDKFVSLFDNSSIVVKSFASIDEMINALSAESENKIDSIVLPKIENFGLILSNDKLHISYNFNEIRRDYVFRLGSDEKLNEIIIKYFNKWKDLKYDESFEKSFCNDYFNFSNIDDKGKAAFKSKRYLYGFVENKPYDAFINDDLYGINKAFLESFSDMADIDIDYKKYDSYESLVSDFNSGKVDILFDNIHGFDYSTSFVDLVSNYDEQVSVLTLPSNKVTVGSVKALVGYNVATISNTKLLKFLQDKGISVTGYDSISSLLDRVDEETIIVVDSEIYNFYSSSKFSKYKSVYSFDIDEQYFFKVLNNEKNSIFINFLNFYLSFISSQEISNLGYSQLDDISSATNYTWIVIIFIGICIIGLVLFLLYQNKKNSSPRVVITRDSKIKYIDVLTSLKNRNFLNDNIDSWDESMVYPQGLIVVDLNNIAYINDNYGHAEGDKVIKEAANILIKTQISNTEIMRTNGNEFLIYTVGYDEKQIISYIRKLNKEFKDLSHSFGAAIGYSIITDEIKTVDDAINEATLNMKNVKRENK